MDYPQTGPAWAAQIAEGLGLAEASARAQHAAGTLNRAAVTAWIEQAFGDGPYSDPFVPALTRNLEGLLRWAYADGGEPYWPGSDEDPGPTR